MSEYRKEYPAIGFQPMTCGDANKIWKNECPQYGINRICCIECANLTDCNDSCISIVKECELKECNFVGPDAIRIDKIELNETCKLRTPHLEDLDMLTGPLFCISECEYIEATKKCEAGILDNPKFYTTIQFLDVSFIKYIAFHEGVLIVWGWARPGSKANTEWEGVINV